MLDQLNSHAQVGISVTVQKNDASGTMNDLSNHNRYAETIELQEEIVKLVGQAVGFELHSLLSKNSTGAKSSRFCCPLDEALVECLLISNEDGTGSLSRFTLPPYGSFPKGGRTKIGSWGTCHVKSFFEAIAESMQIDISLVKMRGHNGHHIVESSFKAFSRALRNLLDGVDIDSMSTLSEELQASEEKKETHDDFDKLWGIDSDSFKMGMEMERQGKIERCTKETAIVVDAKLIPPSMKDSIFIKTGIPMLDTIFSELATHAGMQLHISCKGDLHIDDHHSAEDVAIAFGKVLNTALGTKAGLNRMWLGKVSVGDCTVEVTMDLSNRPCLTSNLSLATLSSEELVKGLSLEMVDHVLDSIVMNGQMTVHVMEVMSKPGPNAMEDLLIATARAFGKALKMCMSVDPRRKGATASSKGTLSV